MDESFVDTRRRRDRKAPVHTPPEEEEEEEGRLFDTDEEYESPKKKSKNDREAGQESPSGSRDAAPKGGVKGDNTAKMKRCMELFKKYHQKRGYDHFGHSVIEEIRGHDADYQSLTEMALVLESASQVYSYRVEAAVIHCKQAHDICAGAKVKPAPGEKDAETGDAASKKKARKHDVVDNHQERMAKIFEDIGSRQGGNNEDEELEEGVEADDIEEEPAEEELDDPVEKLIRVWDGWSSKMDFMRRHTEERERRLNELQQSRYYETNPKLIDDASTLRVRRKDFRQNPYYAMATYNKNHDYNNRIFTRNCVQTGDGRKLLLNPRTADSNRQDRVCLPYTIDYLDAISGLCGNALSSQSQTYGFFFPKTVVNTKDKELAADGDEENYILENDELEQITNQREEDTSAMPDHTIWDQTMVNRTIAFRGGAGQKRVTLKGLGEKQIRMDDRLEQFASASTDPTLAMALADQNMRVLGDHAEELPDMNVVYPPEFTLDVDNISDKEQLTEATRGIRLFGLGPMLTQFESLWHCQWVQMTITDQDLKDQLSALEPLPEPQKSLRRKVVLTPRRYTFFAMGKSMPNYPREINLSTTLLEEPDHTDAEIGNLSLISMVDMMKNYDREENEAPPEMVAGLDGATMVDPDDLADTSFDYEPDNAPAPIGDAALVKIGKLDDSHWNKDAVDKKLLRKQQLLKKQQEQRRKDEKGKREKNFFLPIDEFKRRHRRIDKMFRKRANFQMLTRLDLMPLSVFLNPEKKMQLQRRPAVLADLADSAQYSDFFVKPEDIPFQLDLDNVKHVQRFAAEPLIYKKEDFDRDYLDGMIYEANEAAEAAAGAAGNGGDDDEEEEEPPVVYDFTAPPKENDGDGKRYLAWMGQYKLSFNPKDLQSKEDYPYKTEEDWNMDLGDDPMTYDDPVYDDNNEIDVEATAAKRARPNPFTFEEARLQEDYEEPLNEIVPTEEMSEEDALALNQMLELGRRATQQRVDTYQVKLAIKQVLGNQYLDDSRLMKLAQRYGFTATMAKNLSLGSPDGPSDKENDEEQATADTEEKDDTQESGVARKKIREALNAPPVDPENEQPVVADPTDDDDPNMSQRVGDFEVEGVHSFSGLVSMVPYRLPSQDRNIHVATTLVIALHMCNENGILCEQMASQTSDGLDSKEWMSDFRFRKSGNAHDTSENLEEEFERSRVEYEEQQQRQPLLDGDDDEGMTG
ncbi:unnamed protein product, partial [Mesorhabditis spiculigera]